MPVIKYCFLAKNRVGLKKNTFLTLLVDLYNVWIYIFVPNLVEIKEVVFFPALHTVEAEI